MLVKLNKLIGSYWIHSLKKLSLPFCTLSIWTVNHDLPWTKQTPFLDNKGDVVHIIEFDFFAKHASPIAIASIEYSHHYCETNPKRDFVYKEPASVSIVD
jgi:hypothetical protein